MEFEYKIKGTTLNMVDMSRVKEYYEIACTAEYLLDNYSDKITEDNVMRFASLIREYMDKYSETEEEAIAAILHV